MPKLKTHKGAAKRTRVTKTGKLLHRRPYGNHFLNKKRASRKRRYKRIYKLEGAAKKNMKRELGNQA